MSILAHNILALTLTFVFVLIVVLIEKHLGYDFSLFVTGLMVGLLIPKKTGGWLGGLKR